MAPPATSSNPPIADFAILSQIRLCAWSPRFTLKRPDAAGTSTIAAYEPGARRSRPAVGCSPWHAVHARSKMFACTAAHVLVSVAGSTQPPQVASQPSSSDRLPSSQRSPRPGSVMPSPQREVVATKRLARAPEPANVPRSTVQSALALRRSVSRRRAPAVAPARRDPPAADAERGRVAGRVDDRAGGSSTIVSWAVIVGPPATRAITQRPSHGGGRGEPRAAGRDDDDRDESGAD
jgi:hypothetical protein